MNRFALMKLAASIQEHAQIIEQFTTRSDFDNAHLELEILGRCNLIEEQVANLRSEVVSGQPDIPEGQEQMAL